MALGGLGIAAIDNWDFQSLPEGSERSFEARLRKEISPVQQTFVLHMCVMLHCAPRS